MGKPGEAGCLQRWTRPGQAGTETASTHLMNLRTPTHPADRCTIDVHRQAS
jgi:hypothetical protein